MAALDDRSDLGPLRRASTASTAPTASPASPASPAPPAPAATGRRSAGWLPDVPTERQGHTAHTDGDRDRRLAELRASVGDRLPPAWRGARWGLPPPAALVVLLVTLSLAGLVLAGMLLPRGTAVQQVAPVRAQVTAGPEVSEPAGVDAGAGAGSVPATGAAAVDSRVVVHVVGQVRAPGVVDLPAGSRVTDAVEAAGGLTREADTARVNLARAVVDGEQVHVPRPGEEVHVAVAPVPGPSPAVPSGVPGPAVVDLNAAGVADLDALPGIGPVLSRRIVEWREQHGRFSSVDELGEVSGIGASVLEQVRPLVRV